MSAFMGYSRYYDTFYAEKDYAGEAAFVLGALGKYAARIEAILDLGCGTGAHAAQLAAAGCRVEGVDISPEMIRRARERQQAMPAELAARTRFSCGDIRSFRSAERFDAVTALFHVMSYQPGYADLQAVLDTVQAHLRPGGLFFFDFWYGPAVLHDLPVGRIKRCREGDRELVRVAEPELHLEENTVDVHYTVWSRSTTNALLEEVRETHRMRYWFMPELLHFLGQSRFALCEAGAWMTGRPLSLESWSAFITARLPSA